MMMFQIEPSKIECRPVVLSQFANQGSLTDVAKRLKNTPALISLTCTHYFLQLSDFCTKLMEANTYHPDIKLSNFLVHNNLIRISDRKTLFTDANPKAIKLRSTPRYAPDELVKCFNAKKDGYNNEVASNTTINMPQFMAYQLGMALKEFLILTQRDGLPNDFRNPKRQAADYFNSPSSAIINLSLLAQELTRSVASKRLSIKQFQDLLNFCNLPPKLFYKKVEEALPSATIGIQEDLTVINNLLQGNLNRDELLQQANPVFSKLSKSDPKETRLTRMAEQLAIKCYKGYTKSFITEYSKSLKKCF